MTNPDRVVRVTFRKQVSDGNYGTEAAEISLEDTLPSDGTDEEMDMLAEALLMQARRHVQTELGRSGSATVCRAVALRS
jgi:thymidylate kinase